MSVRIHRGLRPAVALWLGVLALLSVLVAAAAAAAPDYPVIFTGPTARGAYTVELDTGCYGGVGPCTASPTFLAVKVSTPVKTTGGCPANTGFVFQQPILKKDGSFSATQAYAGGLSMTVTGRFTSARSAHGTVSGTHGCAPASFTLKLPAPAAPVPPPGFDACYWLGKANASSILGGAPNPIGTPRASGYSPLTGLGRCDEFTHGHASTNYGAHAWSIVISQDVPDASQGFPKPLAGLGPGAMSAPNLYGNAVYFKIGAAWVVLYFEIPSAAQPPAATVAAQQVKLITVARRVYALMRRA